MLGSQGLEPQPSQSLSKVCLQLSIKAKRPIYVWSTTDLVPAWYD